MSMLIAACTVELQLHAVRSLKEKRSVLRSITRRLPKEFNLATAEVDYHDVWQSSTIGFVTIGNDAGYMHGLLEKAVAWIEDHRPDVEILGYGIEFR